MLKVFHCSGCGQQHKRPINSKCQYKQSELSSTISDNVNMSNDQVKVNQSIADALSAVSSRLEATEKRIDRTEEQIQGKFSGGLANVTSPVASSSHTQELDSIDT